MEPWTREVAVEEVKVVGLRPWYSPVEWMSEERQSEELS